MRKSSSRSKKKRARRYWLFFVLIVIIVFSVYVGIVESQPLPAIKKDLVKYQPNLDSSLQLNWPASGEAALGVAGYGVLATSPKQTAEPTASLAKLMTALAVLEKKPLGLNQAGPTITLTSQDVALYQAYASEGGSVVLVSSGEKISEYQALQAMLLPSANNMADTLANWAFGSVTSYTTYANNLAKTLGLNDSHFADASGFSPLTVSTPSNLITLGNDILQNAVLAQITAQTTATLPVAGVIHNVNWLIGQYNIIGIKTGNTTQAGGTYVFAALYKLSPTQSITLIGSIMQAGSLQQALDEAVPLLQSAKKEIELKQFLAAGTYLGDYQTDWAGDITIANDSPIYFPYLPSMQPLITLSVNKPKPTLDDTQSVGNIVIKMGNTTEMSDLSINQPIKPPSLYWKLTHPFDIL